MNEDSTTAETKSRKEREYERHRLEILDAAERVFVRNGRGASMASIAAEAQVSVGSVYNFYENKDELFRSVLIKIADERVERAAEAVGDGEGDPWVVMRRLVEWWIGHHIEHGDFLLVSVALSVENGVDKSRSDESEVMREMKVRARRYRETLTPFFKRLAPRGCGLSPDDVYMFFEGYMRTLLFHAVHSAPSLDVGAFADRACKSLKAVLSK